MSDSIDDYIVRALKEDECDQVITMIKELAEFEKMADRVENTAEGLKQDIFGQPQRCSCLVAENIKDKEIGIVGYALYFPCYSTWQRTYLHLEDYYVKSDYQGKGIGKKLYKAFVQIAVDMGCDRCQLDVLGWNKKAKDFYEKVGNIDLTETEDWHKMRLKREQMEAFVKEG